MSVEKDCLTTQELSERPGYPSAKTIHDWRTTGEGPPFIRRGGRIHYLLEQVVAWEEEQNFTPGSEAVG